MYDIAGNRENDRESWRGNIRLSAVVVMEVKCGNVSELELEIQGPVLRLQAIKVDEAVDGVDVVVEMDISKRLCGATVCREGVEFDDKWRKKAVGVTDYWQLESSVLSLTGTFPNEKQGDLL